MYSLEKLQKIFILANTSCNMKCNHCYLPQNNDMDPNELLNMVQLLKDKYQIVLTGSELLMNLNYLKSFKEINQYFIFTNGIILYKNPETFELLRSNGISSIGISYHFGIDKILGSVPREIVFSVTDEALKRDFGFRILTTITSQNYDMIEIMCEEAVSAGAHSIKFFNFIKTGRGKHLDDLALSQQQIDIFYEKINKMRAIYKKEDFKIVCEATFGPRKNSKSEILANQNCFCQAGERVIAIDSSKKIYGCPFTSAFGSEIGCFKNNQIIIDKKLYPCTRNDCLARII